MSFYYQSLPIATILALINIINVCLIIWIFRQSSIAHNQVDLYLYSLTEVRNFSTITRFVAQLTMDDEQKQLLQKALVSRSLGLTVPNIHPPTSRPSE